MADTKYDETKVIELILKHKGNVTMVAKALKCSRTTIQTYAKDNPAIEQALHETRESMTDLAESKLYNALQKGDAWAICFYLKTQGKSRGYIERTEKDITSGNKPLKGYVLVSPDDWDESG